MDILTLQITRNSFCDILEGKQLTEHRYIYPSNAGLYILQHDNRDGTCDVDIRYYDALKLVNGRRKDAPRMVVEVLGADIIEYTDENGNIAKATDKHGQVYYVYGIRYLLGKIISIENTEILRQFRK